MKIRVRGLASPSAILAGLLSLCLSTIGYASGPGWYDNFEQAVQAARQQGRPIFVDFSTSWCSVCKQMDRTTLSDPGIIGRLDNFIKVKVDGDARPDLCSTYGVEAYPTFLNLDSSGRVLEKREGFMRSQELAGTLDRIWQGVSASMAIAQANQKPAAGQQAQPSVPGAAQQQQASAAQQPRSDVALLAPNDESGQMEISTSAKANSANNSKVANTENLYNTDNTAKVEPQLQGSSVYALGSGPTAERRSRFGGSTQEGTELRQLAEATAQPGALEAEEPSAYGKSLTAAATKKTPDAAGDDLAEKATSDKPAAKTAETNSIKKPDIAAADTIRQESDKKATAKPAVVVASADRSPIIQSRLAGLSEAQLPKPLLSRTSSSAPEPMAAAPTIVQAVSTPTADPLATIKRLQGNDIGSKPAVSTKPVEIAATANVEKKAPQAAGEAAPKSEPAAEKSDSIPVKAEKPPNSNAPEAVAEKEIGESSAKKTASSSSADSKSAAATADEGKSKTTASKSDKPEADEASKTPAGATKSDIDRWMKDADSKLVSERKTEARAMYSKVVDKDPDNQFGKSDTAYVKMVSLIVDRDSDPLRRQAYNKIKEFEARYPESDHKDYYTLIRAILAADLGETNEAHKLLGTYSDRFPDSKYLKVAHSTWKSLPAAKKESSTKAKTKSSVNSGSSKSKNSDS